MKQYEEIIGYFKITGKSIENGVISAKSAYMVLESIDRTVNRAIKRKYPELSGIQLDIPVEIKKGSWQALIPDSLVDWVITAVGTGAITYATTAAKKMAENDFDKKGIKEATVSGIKTLQSVIKLHKHLKGSKNRKINGVKFKDNNKTLSIPNDEGKFIDISKSDFDDYYNFPENILKELAESPTNDQTLSIGVVEDGVTVEENIGYKDRSLFGITDSLENNTIDVLFPELRHGDKVELIGEVTRGNNQSNSMGFKYKEHILTCFPSKGRVSDFKQQLFSKCIIRGEVIRVTDMTFTESNRPRIKFDDLEMIVEDDQISQQKLLDV